MNYNVSNASYTLPPPSVTGNQNSDPLNSGTVGALVAVSPSQITAITPEFTNPTYVTLINVGSISLIVSPSAQNIYPNGVRLPGGYPIRIATTSPLYVAAPPTAIFNGTTVLYPSLAYVVVTIER